MVRLSDDNSRGNVQNVRGGSSYTFPAAIEFEYNPPPGSDAVKEVAKCLTYCRAALAST